MVELKCRAETAVTGRSACRNALCEHSKERGGRIPQGKLRWGIGGPGGHSMKWYCIRPACLPADQVKDMLVPEKCASASVMEGVPELPDGFREATITCLEYIRDDKADQLDAAVLAQLDEVGPLIPVAPRPPVRGDVPPPTIAGRQGLRRVRRSTGSTSALGGGGGGGGGGVGGGVSGGSSVGVGGGEDDEEEEDDSEDEAAGAMGRGGGMGASISSLPARTPPALLIPRRASVHGGDSPIFPPPEKVPKLDDVMGESGDGLGGASSGHLLSLAGMPPAHESYHAPDPVSLYGGGALSDPIEHSAVEGGRVAGLGLGLGDAVGGAEGGQGAAGSPLSYSELGIEHGVAGTTGLTFEEKKPAESSEPSPPGFPGDVTGASFEPSPPPSSESIERGTPSVAHDSGAGATSHDPSQVERFSARSGAPLGIIGGGGGGGGVSGEAGLDTLSTSPDPITGSLLGGGVDAVSSALEGIDDDLIGEVGSSAPSSDAFGSSLIRGGSAASVANLPAASAGEDAAGTGIAVPAAPAVALPTTDGSGAHVGAPSGGSGEIPGVAATIPTGGDMIATATPPLAGAAAGAVVDEAYAGTFAGGEGGVSTTTLPAASTLPTDLPHPTRSEGDLDEDAAAPEENVSSGAPAIADPRLP